MKAMARSPMAFGPMTKKCLPDDMVKEGVTPLQTNKQIGRDLTKYLRSVDRLELSRNAVALCGCEVPVLVAWAAEDALIPPERGQRLAGLLPSGRYVEIPESRTLIPIDQPDVLADHIRSFVAEPDVAFPTDR
jgi:pimeloyl-ACP methyl ester carboxylesterase